jgi:PAS domain S-box-containing protein
MLQNSINDNSIQGWIGSIGLALAVAVGYFLAAQLGLALLTTPERVAVFWPASGIAAGILIALGFRARTPVATGVIAATLAANLMLDRSFWGGLALGLCNASEALLVAWLIERWSGPFFNIESVRRVLLFLVAATVATSTAAVGAAGALSLFGPSTAAFLSVWQVWFASDALGMIVVAPLLIELAAAVRSPPTWHEFIEGTLALLALAVTIGFALMLLTGPWLTIVPATLLFPLLLWLGARCRPLFAAAGVLINAVAIVWTTTYEFGLYGDPSLRIGDRVLAAQVAILATTLVALALAALFAERRRYETALATTEARYRMCYEDNPSILFTVDTGGSVLSVNKYGAELLGYTSAELVGKSVLQVVHDDDWEVAQRQLDECAQKPFTIVNSEIRKVRRDGSIFWAKEAVRAVPFPQGQTVILIVCEDITDLKQAEERQDMLMAELDHRVKNVLARVSAVAMNTRQGSDSIDQFVRTLDGRIQTMAAVHSLLGQSRWNGAGITDLVRQQLAPYTTDTNTTISGSDVMLTSAATQALAMALHELVTNAAKYGALSTPNGRVSVSWRRNSNGATATSLTMEWREFDGPPVVAPTKSGYGTSLIRNLIPHELGGRIDLAFASEGVSCRIEIPIRQG